MNPFNFPDAASIDDLMRLECARLRRFGELMPLGSDTITFLDGSYNLTISGGPAIAALDPAEIHKVAWLVFGSEMLTLFSCNLLIYQAVITAGISRSRLLGLESESASASAEVDMATATATRPETNNATRTTSRRSTPQAVPTLKSLRRIADKTGMSEAAIAEEMIGLNLTVYRDEDGIAYKAPLNHIEKWAEHWSLQFARKQQTWLLEDEQPSTNGTNGRVEAMEEPAQTDEEPTQIEEPTEGLEPQQALPTLRFSPRKPNIEKGFSARAFRTTLDNALQALAKGADEQLVLAAALAKPEENEQLSKAALDKILSLYSAEEIKAKGDKIRKGLQSAALQWLSEAKQPEATV